MSRIHIDEVYPKSEAYPYIVNFQNGYPSEHFNSTQCMILIDERAKTKSIAAEVGRCLYLGEEPEEGLGLRNTSILARNRTTGKVRLIQAATIELKPEQKSDLETSQLLDNSSLELGRKFGSKKYKQVLEQREKLKQNEQAVVAQMANVSQTLTEDQLDVSSYTEQETDFYIPPINRDATTVTEVYDLNTILTPEHYEIILNEIKNTDYMEKLHPFIKQSMKKDLSPKEKVLALYASSLYKSYFAKSSEFNRKSFIVCFESLTLNKHILENFFNNVSGRRYRPTQYKDKSLIYTIVLLFLISNYKFNLDEFCKVTKSAVRTMVSKLSMTGGSSKQVDGMRIAVLKLPLSKPSSRRKSTKL